VVIAMELSVISVKSRKDLKKFVMLPWKIYEGNKYWVPPIIKDILYTLTPGKNTSIDRIDRELFLVFTDNEPAGRIYVGIDNDLNKKKNSSMGFISLFECINSYDVAKKLFDTAVSWFKGKGIAMITGPVSPIGSEDDENKGLLIDCFDRPPVLMNSYNPPYYVEFFERYGFTKDFDLFAYYLSADSIFKKDTAKIIEYAKKKYNFRVDAINLKNLEEEIKAIKYVLDLAVPDEWPDLVAPSMEDIREIAKKLIGYTDPDLVIIARSGDKPIGFAIALPDYNQALIHLNGRITPLSALKFFRYKRKIDCARVFIMFVIPSFRSKGVSYAIYYQIFVNAIKKGYTWGEGSTIGETNLRMRNDIESFGGKHYKTYRVYKLET
jgi:GNAT superfamily N-acetyltransferase